MIVWRISRQSPYILDTRRTLEYFCYYLLSKYAYSIELECVWIYVVIAWKEQINSMKMIVQNSLIIKEDDLSDSTQSEFEYHETSESDSETSESNRVLYPEVLL